jgi:FixJ family two-component response regulator
VSRRAYVAVVDDERQGRTALNRLLRLANYDTAVFASGEAFLDSIGARRPDCVVLDVHMPGLSGFDVQARLESAQVDVAVIFITASDAPDLERIALAAGGVRLLRKPFSNDDLLAAVDAALRSKSSDAS